MRFILLGLLLISSNSLASGLGDETCGEFLTVFAPSDVEVPEGMESVEELQELLQEMAMMAYLHWAQGYVTAQGKHTALSEPEGPAVPLFLAQHCAQNPLDSFQEAVDSLVVELAE